MTSLLLGSASVVQALSSLVLFFSFLLIRQREAREKESLSLPQAHPDTAYIASMKEFLLLQYQNAELSVHVRMTYVGYVACLRCFKVGRDLSACRYVSYMMSLERVRKMLSLVS